MCTGANPSPIKGEWDVPDRPLVPALTDLDTDIDSINAEQRDMQVATQDSCGHVNGEDGENPRATPRNIFDGMEKNKTSVPIFVPRPYDRVDHRHTSIQMDESFNTSILRYEALLIDYSRKPVNDRGPAPVGYANWMMDGRISFTEGYQRMHKG